MHNTHMVGEYWANINNCEEREICTTCNISKPMAHILMQCNAPLRHIIWTLVEELWSHPNIWWPEIELGMILGCGCINLPENNAKNPEANQRNRRVTHRGES